VSSGAIASPKPATAAPSRRRKHLTDPAKRQRRPAATLVGPAAVVVIAVGAYPVLAAVAVGSVPVAGPFPLFTGLCPSMRPCNSGGMD